MVCLCQYHGNKNYLILIGPSHESRMISSTHPSPIVPPSPPPFPLSPPPALPSLPSPPPFPPPPPTHLTSHTQMTPVKCRHSSYWLATCGYLDQMSSPSPTPSPTSHASHKHSYRLASLQVQGGACKMCTERITISYYHVELYCHCGPYIPLWTLHTTVDITCMYHHGDYMLS